MLNSTYVRVLATTEQGLTREETLQGRSYLVMPVVALVEGVLQGANSEGPEFAAAAEFGRNIQGWNGRPIVMDHPQNADGAYVSANSSEVMNAWAFGWIFNASVEDNKLKVEAWLDTARAEELGGNFLETLERIRDGGMVEVSVGVFINPISKKGKYKGKAYSSVWTNVVPDHLAFLSNGKTGACSNEDGCGAPRINRSMMADGVGEAPGEGEGEGEGENPGAAETILDTNTNAGQETPSCTCQDTTAAPGLSTEAQDQDQDQPQTLSPNWQERAAALFAFALPSDRFNNDIYKAISKAVQDKYKGYCYGYTTDYVVYDTYDYTTGAYACYKVGISVDSNLEVAFTSTPVEVKVIMQIIDATQTEDTMSNNTTQAGTDAPAPVISSNNNPPASAAATPVTISDYIAAAPVEVREVLSESMRVHAERKAATIKVLTETGRCPYSEVELKAMSIEDLGKLVKLAGIQAQPQNAAASAGMLIDYTGLGAPRVELSAEENRTPEPLKIWPN